MTAVTRQPARASHTQTFAALHIDRRVLTTPSRTIPIANVATVSVGTHVGHRPRLLLLVGAATLAVMAFGATQIGLAAMGTINIVAVVLGLLAAGLALFALKPDDKTHYLLISSSDGVMTRFAADDRNVLEEVRRLLSERINSGAEAPTYSVNFETGVIENLSIAAPTATASSLSAPQPASAAANGGGRPHPEPAFSNDRAASGAFPRGPAPNGAAPTQAPAEVYIDFSALLPAVVEMYRFYARQPNAQHLEQRLSELELLMRAGAQTQGQKSRVRELTRDLAHILQAYQPAVQVFERISGMAA